MKVCTLASSSAGNSTLVSEGAVNILIDAGISMRRTVGALRSVGVDPAELTAILVTHEHSDHICGLKMMTKYFGLPIYTTEGTAQGICKVCPETAGYISVFNPGNAFELADMHIETFPTPHDTPASVGFRITSGGRVFALATDTGCLSDSVLSGVLGADTAIIEANHDMELLRTGPYPYHLKRRILSDRGHMSNGVCGVFAQKLVQSGTRRIILAHLSKENNTPALAVREVGGALMQAGVIPGRDVDLSVAPRDTVSDVFVI